MKTAYIANDGTIFDDEWKCEEYEIISKGLNKVTIDEIEAYDDRGNKFNIKQLTSAEIGRMDLVKCKTLKAVEFIKNYQDFQGLVSPYDKYDELDKAMLNKFFYYNHKLDEWQLVKDLIKQHINDMLYTLEDYTSIIKDEIKIALKEIAEEYMNE